MKLIDDIEVHDRLLEWCESFDRGYNPVPSLTIAGAYTSLEIGGELIWDTESGYADEVTDPEGIDGLTVENAIRCYKNLIEMKSGWPK